MSRRHHHEPRNKVRLFDQHGIELPKPVRKDRADTLVGQGFAVPMMAGKRRVRNALRLTRSLAEIHGGIPSERLLDPRWPLAQRTIQRVPIGTPGSGHYAYEWRDWVIQEAGIKIGQGAEAASHQL